eukprot:scaffold84595_cov45-Phaeocystis_antarctica.AAC.1
MRVPRRTRTDVEHSPPAAAARCVPGLGFLLGAVGAVRNAVGETDERRARGQRVVLVTVGVRVRVRAAGQGQWPTGRVRARARARVRVRVRVGRKRVVLHDGEGHATRGRLAQQPLYLEVYLAWLGLGLGFGWG